MKRGYTHVKMHESQILEMQQLGKTKREIGEALGLTKEQVKGCLKRFRQRYATV